MRAITRRRVATGVALAAAAAAASACDERTTAPRAADPAPSLSRLHVYGQGGGRHDACDAPAYRQFDFWVGKWDVNGPRGRLLGANVIEREVDGCVIEENWTGNGGVRGRSMNTYDAGTRRWNQMWVDVTASPLFLVGGLVDGSMVLEGRRVFPDPTRPEGFVVDDSIVWTPFTTDSLRQHWLLAFNGDAPFTGFDGHYRRVAEVTPIPVVASPTCTDPASPQFRQLDFLVGRWVVKLGSGHGHGGGHGLGLIRSTVTTDLDGCLVEEHVEGLGRYEGMSFTAYDPLSARWHRTYMDNLGQRLQLAGTLQGDAMVLAGTGWLGRRRVQVRVTLRPAGAARVSERWEVAEAGRPWRLEAEVVRLRRE